MIIDNMEEIGQKVVGSICMANGEGPYYISDASASYATAVDKSGKNIHIPKPRSVDWRPPKLGYITSGNNTYFLSRNPCRRWKVGIYPRNIKPNVFDRITYVDILKGLDTAQKNFYNNQRSYLEKIKIGMVVPLSRNYAISRDSLFFQDEKIGNHKNNTIEFFSEKDMMYHQNNLLSVTDDMEFSYKERVAVDYDKDDV